MESDFTHQSPSLIQSFKSAQLLKDLGKRNWSIANLPRSLRYALCRLQQGFSRWLKPGNKSGLGFWIPRIHLNHLHWHHSQQLGRRLRLNESQHVSRLHVSCLQTRSSSCCFAFEIWTGFFHLGILTGLRRAARDIWTMMTTEKDLKHPKGSKKIADYLQEFQTIQREYVLGGILPTGLYFGRLLGGCMTQTCAAHVAMGGNGDAHTMGMGGGSGWAEC